MQNHYPIAYQTPAQRPARGQAINQRRRSHKIAKIGFLAILTIDRWDDRIERSWWCNDNFCERCHTLLDEHTVLYVPLPRDLRGRAVRRVANSSTSEPHWHHKLQVSMLFVNVIRQMGEGHLTCGLQVPSPQCGQRGVLNIFVHVLKSVIPSMHEKLSAISVAFPCVNSFVSFRAVISARRLTRKGEVPSLN